MLTAVKREIIPLLFGVLCLALAGVTVLPTLGEWLAIGARNQLSERAKTRQLPSEHDWRAGYAVLQQAAALDSHDPQIQFELGRMSLWQAYHASTGSGERQDWLDAGVKHLRKALKGRPTWGQAWAELAFVHVQKGDQLAAVDALKQAMHFEPYEGHTQWMVLASGFAVWPMLYGEAQTQFLRIVEHAMQSYWVERVIVPAVHNGHESVIRHLVEGHVRAEKIMRKALAERESAKSHG